MLEEVSSEQMSHWAIGGNIPNFVFLLSLVLM